VKRRILSFWRICRIDSDPINFKGRSNRARQKKANQKKGARILDREE
jgi:hypothetical protein